jgi:hypothetical protein
METKSPDPFELFDPLVQASIPTAVLVVPVDDVDDLAMIHQQQQPVLLSDPHPQRAIVPTAVHIPMAQDDNNIHSSSSFSSEHQYRLTRIGERVGRAQAEEEAQAIARAGREGQAISHQSAAALGEANRMARMRDDLETKLLLAEVAVAADEERLVGVSANIKREAEVIGTFGKEYEVSLYDVNKYGTRDYDVAPYKSVYEEK